MFANPLRSLSDNETAVTMVLDAIKSTEKDLSPHSQFLKLPDKGRSFIANSIINEISPISAPGFFAMYSSKLTPSFEMLESIPTSSHPPCSQGQKFAGSSVLVSDDSDL